MKTNLLLLALGCGLAAPATAAAQTEDATFSYESVTAVEVEGDCTTSYTANWKRNWFLQLGAGIQSPFVENYLPDGSQKHHLTAAYNLGVGKYISPYLAWRLSAYYGEIRWDNVTTATAKQANLNFDLMWDMFNSIGGYNPDRVFSIVPFVGLGGTFVWDYDNNEAANDYKAPGKVKKNQWMLPVSAGLQMRFRLCKYVDFFLEGRACFYGDNYNNVAYDDPIDINISAIGGFTFKFGGRSFSAVNPCDYLAQIAGLNAQVNALRGELAATSVALAECEAQLPCPEVQPSTTVVNAPMLSCVRFTINSAVVTPEEMVNVYNVAQYMKDNPDVKIVIKGYADKDTGTAAYNMDLSQRRAQAVYDILTNTYGIAGSRLTIQPYGSDSQVYPAENDWNRIVIFAQ